MSATSRLAVVLADVFIPADATVPSSVALLADSSLERVARFANATPIDDWRSWAAREWRLPWTPFWRATPVHLEARLDYVRVAERGLVRLDEASQRNLAADFNLVFGSQYALRPSPRGDFELLGCALDESAVVTTDPATLLGMDIHEGLARGPGAAVVRALGAEIEMWLHEHPVNEQRRRAGAQGVSSLWLWRSLELGRWECPPEADLRQYEQAQSESIVPLVVLWPMTHGSLDQVERGWLEPALARVVSGELDLLEIVANNQVFSLRRRDLWKRWRRPRSWIEALRGKVS